MKIAEIPSAPGYYATDEGDIISKGEAWPKGRRFMRQQSDGRAGYAKVAIAHSDGTIRSRYVHHLVAEAFLGPRPERCDIDHVNGDRTDNRVENLRYCSRRENQDNPANRGQNAWQRRAGRRVVATKDDAVIVFDNANAAAKTLGLCLFGIWGVLSGKPVNKGRRRGKPRFCRVRTCGGYTFNWIFD